MDIRKSIAPLALITFGLVAGVIVAWILFEVLGARPTEVNIGPIKFDLPPADTTTSSLNDNILSLESLPFIAFAWSTADVQSEKGWANLSIINDTKSQKMYYFEYILPMTSTKYSGAGLTFKFDDPQNLTEYDPQDLTEYSYVSINITFGSPDTRCDLILWDISNKSKSVALSPNIALNQDIERRRSGLTETFIIPLDTWYENGPNKVRTPESSTC